MAEQNMRIAARLGDRPDLEIGSSHRDLLDEEDWDFAGGDTQYLLHSLHPYPARFIPQIPRRAITRWSAPGQMILDPFCGCGTALLESALCGRNSIGVDNNGVATLVSRAKVTRYDEWDLAAVRRLVDTVRDRPYPQQDDTATSEWLREAPWYPYRGKWFSDQAVVELARLRALITDLKPRPQLLALAVFSSLIVRASRQDSDTRYADVSRQYSKGLAGQLWVERANDVIEKAKLTASLIGSGSHEVFTADSRKLRFLEAESIDLIVTSPPYLNAYDYHKYHRHRLHWIGADVALARDSEVGRHDVFTRPRASPDPYFRDLFGCMTEWNRVLKPGARAFVVVGDAIVNRRFVPVGDTLVGLGSKAGLVPLRRWIRRLDPSRKSFNQGARITREHLLLFAKPN